MNDRSMPENVLVWARLAGWNEQEIMSTTIEERLVRFTAIVLSEARAECIDVVTRNGGSVEIEHAIRNLAKWGTYPRQTTPVSCQLYGHIVGCAECNNPPQREPLTDERLNDIFFCVGGGRTVLETWRQQARAIERAHGIGGEK